MRLELLQVPGCPNVTLLHQRLEQALAPLTRPNELSGPHDKSGLIGPRLILWGSSGGYIDRSEATGSSSCVGSP
jgi:hypothetical protein